MAIPTQEAYDSNWITPLSQYNALCLSWARKIQSELPVWVSPESGELDSKKNHSFSFPAIRLIAEYAPYEPATDWYTTLQKLALMIPGLLNQTIPPMPENIIGFFESKCPIYGKPYKTKDTQVLTLFSKEFESLNQIHKIFAQYAQNYLPNEKPFKLAPFSQQLFRRNGNSPIEKTYWGLQTISAPPLGQMNLSPKPNWNYDRACLTERFIAYATHTIAQREKIRKNSENEINFGIVSTRMTYAPTSTGPDGEALVLAMSTSKGIVISGSKADSAAPRIAAIAIFN